jgi:hypothetical protein
MMMSRFFLFLALMIVCFFCMTNRSTDAFMSVVRLSHDSALLHRNFLVVDTTRSSLESNSNNYLKHSFIASAVLSKIDDVISLSTPRINSAPLSLTSAEVKARMDAQLKKLHIKDGTSPRLTKNVSKI